MIGWADMEYKELLTNIFKHGHTVQSRNGVTRRLIAPRASFGSTPLISLRRCAWKNALREMEWFLSGSSNIEDLHPKVKHWWSPWANYKGEINNNYSKQFRSFDGKHFALDQIEHIVEQLNERPYSRRHVVSTWNSSEMAQHNTPIANCHGTIIQFFVRPDTEQLSMHMYQRSCDVIVGLPHNWIQYWALLMWIARRAGRPVGQFIWTGGDCHIYEAHTELAWDMATVDYSALPESITPDLVLKEDADHKVFRAEDFDLTHEYEAVFDQKAALIV